MGMGNLTPSMGDLNPSRIGDLIPPCCGKDLTPLVSSEDDITLSAMSGEDLTPSAISGEDLTPSAISGEDFTPSANSGDLTPADSSGDLTPSLQFKLSPPGVVGSPGRQEECLG